jgi:CDP-diacylglycerol--glycerol-3-phosphate 3-phosphatidyltransferase
LSGANLNADYFTNRQDRYLLFQKTPNLSDFMADLIDAISSFSYSLKWGSPPTSSSLPPSNSEVKEPPKDYTLDSYLPQNHPNLIGASKLNQVYNQWTERMSDQSPPVSPSQSSLPFGTWVYPTLQMGLLGIRQEEAVLSLIFDTLREQHPELELDLSSAYLNFPSEYQKLILNAKGITRILTAAPEANGFFGANNVSGYLPHAYTYLESNLYQRVLESGHADRISFHEYNRKDWTFHAKGFWVTEPRFGPILTSIGSSNFNARSLDRDLEVQSFILTDCPDLSPRIQENKRFLMSFTKQVGKKDFELPERKVPFLVKVATMMVSSML